MSILQEYEENRKIIGNGKVDAIDDYINDMEKNGIYIFYHQIVYKKSEWEKYEKWYQDAILPFVIVRYEDNKGSLLLNEDNFDYSLFLKRNKDGFVGNGYDHESLFRSYIKKYHNEILPKLSFDSECGMVCINATNVRDLDEFVYPLAKDYREKTKMLELVPEIERYEFYL